MVTTSQADIHVAKYSLIWACNVQCAFRPGGLVVTPRMLLEEEQVLGFESHEDWTFELL